VFGGMVGGVLKDMSSFRAGSRGSSLWDKPRDELVRTGV
jgi:hypothetical protein